MEGINVSGSDPWSTYTKHTIITTYPSSQRYFLFLRYFLGDIFCSCSFTLSTTNPATKTMGPPLLCTRVTDQQFLSSNSAVVFLLGFLQCFENCFGDQLTNAFGMRPIHINCDRWAKCLVDHLWSRGSADSNCSCCCV